MGIIAARQQNGTKVILNPRHIAAAYVVSPEETRGTIAESRVFRVVVIMSEGSVYTVAEARSQQAAETARDELAARW